jgi:nicotinamidase-related amidase
VGSSVALSNSCAGSRELLPIFVVNTLRLLAARLECQYRAKLLAMPTNLKRALLVIDIQNEYFTGKLPITYPSGSLTNVLNAMDAARAKGLPVAVIQHASPQPDAPVFRMGSKEWELHPQVAARQYEVLIQKSLPGSFTGTQLEAWLQQRGVNTVVIAGYMTQMCCDTTARQAMHLGFGVEFLSDGTGTLSIKNEAGEVSDEELHRAILVTQQMRFSRVLKTSTWIDQL